MRTTFIYLFSTFLITLGFLGNSFSSKAQVILNYANFYDHNHYSVEAIGSYSVVAGTLFDPGSNTTNTHVMKLDAAGNIIWEKTIDFGTEERCFDVCLGRQNTIAITGVVDDQMFMAELNSVGNITYYKKVTSPSKSVGLSIIYSPLQRSYYVAGYTSPTDVLSTTSVKWGLLIKVDSRFNLQWSREIKNSYSVLANDLTELGTYGVLVTGKVYEGSPATTDHDGLRVMYNHSGTSQWDLSTVSIDKKVYPLGVSYEPINSTVADAVYDAPSDAIFLVTNVDHSHNYVIERIDGVSTGSPAITWMANDTLLPGQYTNSNFAGLAIELDPNDQQLLVAGICEEQPAAGAPATNDSPSFLAKYSKTGGALQWWKYWTVTAPNYNTHDIDVFQAFYTTHPYISHPDILATRTADDYIVLGYDDGDGANSYDLNFIQTDNNGHVMYAPLCEKDVYWDDYRTILYSYDPTFDIDPGVVITDIEYNTPFVEHFIEYPCGGNKKSPSTNIDELTNDDHSLRVFPNPASNQLHVEFETDLKKGTLRLVTLSGQKLQEVQLNGEDQVTLDVSALDAGTYLLILQSDSTPSSRIITIQ